MLFSFDDPSPEEPSFPFFGTPPLLHLPATASTAPLAFDAKEGIELTAYKATRERRETSRERTERRAITATRATATYTDNRATATIS